MQATKNEWKCCRTHNLKGPFSLGGCIWQPCLRRLGFFSGIRAPGADPQSSGRSSASCTERPLQWDRTHRFLLLFNTENARAYADTNIKLKKAIHWHFCLMHLSTTVSAIPEFHEHIPSSTWSPVCGQQHYSASCKSSESRMQNKRKVHLSRTSELLLLLFTHPVDSEAGCGSKTTPKNFFVGLSPPLSNRTLVLCKHTHTHTTILKLSSKHCLTITRHYSSNA